MKILKFKYDPGIYAVITHMLKQRVTHGAQCSPPFYSISQSIKRRLRVKNRRFLTNFTGKQ